MNNIFFRCVNYYLDEIACNGIGGRVYNGSLTQSQCESYGYVCRTPETVVTGIYGNLNELTGECGEGEEKVAVFSWKKAEWIGGKFVKTEWKRREVIYPNEVRSTLYFPTISYWVLLPSASEWITSLQSQV